MSWFTFIFIPVPYYPPSAVFVHALDFIGKIFVFRNLFAATATWHHCTSNANSPVFFGRFASRRLPTLLIMTTLVFLHPPVEGGLYQVIELFKDVPLHPPRFRGASFALDHTSVLIASLWCPLDNILLWGARFLRVPTSRWLWSCIHQLVMPIENFADQWF